MSQLKRLTAFLMDTVPPRVMQGFDSEMDEVTFIPAQCDTGLGQYRLSIIRYNAVLTWSRFPYREYDPQILMALFQVWLIQEGPAVFEEIGIDTEQPDFDVEVTDSETAIVVVMLPMAEELNLVPDENGPIPFDGQRWRLDSPEIWTATDADVVPV